MDVCFATMSVGCGTVVLNEVHMNRLSEREKRILDFEQRCMLRGDSRAAAIRAQFGLSQARYYQLLDALIDSQQALVADPLLVYRLQRLREKRLAGNSGMSRPTERERDGREVP